VKLRYSTIAIGVMIRAPATTLEMSGMRAPCRYASLIRFQLMGKLLAFENRI